MAKRFTDVNETPDEQEPEAARASRFSPFANKNAEDARAEALGTEAWSADTIGLEGTMPDEDKARIANEAVTFAREAGVKAVKQAQDLLSLYQKTLKSRNPDVLVEFWVALDKIVKGDPDITRGVIMAYMANLLHLQGRA